MEQKKRSVALTGNIPRHWARYISTQNRWVEYKLEDPPLKSTETTLTESHAWPKKWPAGLDDVGGDFSTIKVSKYYNFTPQNFTSIRTGNFQYLGPAWPVDPRIYLDQPYLYNRVPFTSDSELRTLGSSAIARCIPTNPASDAATFIGELKKGLPQAIGKELFKTKLKDYRKVGSEYLNVEFGWKPLVTDLMSFADAAQNSDRILKQLERDSGRLVRRRYSFPDEITNEFLDEPAVTPWTPVNAGNTGGWQPAVLISGRRTRERMITTKTWFSGAFTYHLNMGTRLRDKMDRISAEARKLYGLQVTPELAWNLAPWSWLADWEGNIGDVLHNLSQFSQDGLVMPYGYIMQHKQVVDDWTLYGGVNTGSTEPPLRLQITYDSKIRRKATPFGFGFNMSTLTGRQSAILGALAISRGPGR